MMEVNTYSIIDNHTGIVIAKGMDLATSLILVEGLMNKYFNEPYIAYTVERENRENE